MVAHGQYGKGGEVRLNHPGMERGLRPTDYAVNPPLHETYSIVTSPWPVEYWQV